MDEKKSLEYEIKDAVELNLSYMPFITQGGLFIPTEENFSLGEEIIVNLTLPSKTSPLAIPGKVIWLTPKNALHHVLPGIGIQFIGTEAAATKTEIEKNLDNNMEIGGYVYGMTEEKRTHHKS
jgi:type IV pilus assembly protein PilZ